MPTNHGHFYFRLTSNGNLIGEYSNDGLNGASTESAGRVLVEGESNRLHSFIGLFDTCWLEDKTSKYAQLEIEAVKYGMFSLTWKNKKRDTLYRGKGMIVDGILIGDYAPE